VSCSQRAIHRFAAKSRIRLFEMADAHLAIDQTRAATLRLRLQTAGYYGETDRGRLFHAARARVTQPASAGFRRLACGLQPQAWLSRALNQRRVPSRPSRFASFVIFAPSWSKPPRV